MKISNLILAIAAGLAVSQSVAFAANDGKVTICHATASHSNPYNTQEPNKSGDVSGHDDHDGPIWFPGIEEEWGDIIPPFDYTGGHYDGKNWTAEGQAIFDADCVAPGQEPTPTPTNTPTNTPTPTPTNTPTNTPTPTPTNTPTNTPTPTPTNTPTPTPTVEEPTATPTPTIPVEEDVTPTPTPGSGGNIDLDCLPFRQCEVTPTNTPTPTVTPDPTQGPTPTPGSSTNNDSGTGGTGGANVSSTSSSNNNASNTSQGQVLGVSTLAETGNFKNSVAMAALWLGLVMIGFATIQYGKENSLI